MTPKKVFKVGSVECGSARLFMISGPCVIEDELIMMKTAEALKKISENLQLPVIYKSSFMKDNRSSLEHYHGPGLEEGLKMLEKIKREFELPILTDVHYPEHVGPTGYVVDVVQIPA